jgi:hypothetical protein
MYKWNVHVQNIGFIGQVGAVNETVARLEAWFMYGAIGERKSYKGKRDVNRLIFESDVFWVEKL